jgi:nucleotide-binding universal stress UspA family protein
MAGHDPGVLPRRLLIGYDGTAEARDAIETAAGICENGTAVVVNVWDVVTAEAIAAPDLAVVAAPPRGDLSVSAAERAAIRCARDGADLAHAVGLASEFAACHGSGVEGIASALVAAADRWHADLIVVGRRDISRIREFVLGSVSHAVVRTADRPVLVVGARAAR